MAGRRHAVGEVLERGRQEKSAGIFYYWKESGRGINAPQLDGTGEIGSSPSTARGRLLHDPLGLAPEDQRAPEVYLRGSETPILDSDVAARAELIAAQLRNWKLLCKT